jgi:uncharacterized membrane protein
MAQRPVFLYIGVYDDPAVARADLEVVHVLHLDEVIGAYDAAVAVKQADGSVHIQKHESATRRGAWTGIAAGAIVGILFPPSIIGAAAVGGLAGGLIGHFWRGMSRKDVHELGELLDTGQALLIVVGQDKLSAALEKAELKAHTKVEKQIDMKGEDLDAELAEVSRQVAEHRGDAEGTP